MYIKRLYLQSKNLSAQKAFYVDQLRFECLNESEKSFTISTGATELTFEKSEEDFYYHFAFNIPSFQIKEAFAWLQSKNAEFIKYESSYFLDFKNWNAEAIYFFDADGNIGELIARKNLAIESSETFSAKSILNVSEIGMPVTDVTKVFQILDQDLGMNHYSGDQHYFCVMGEEEGLLIVVDQNAKKWMPTELPAIPAPFRLAAVIKGQDYDIEYNGKEMKFAISSDQ